MPGTMSSPPWDSAGQAEGACSQQFGSVEESVGSAEGRIPRRGALADSRAPQLPFELLDSFGQLGRSAGSGNVGVGSSAGRESDGLIGNAGQRRQNQASVVEREEMPWRRLTQQRGLAARLALLLPRFGLRLGDGCVALRTGSGLGSGETCLQHEVLKLGQAGSIRSKP